MGLFGAGPVVRFRGKLKAGTGDRDIVPIVVEYLGANLTLWATIAPPRASHTKQKPKELQAHELAFKRLTLIQLDALCMQGGLDQLKPLPLHLGEQLEPLDELDWSEGALVSSG